MEMKQVYEALEKVENGADLIAAIKGEINTLNNEAKKHRRRAECDKAEKHLGGCWFRGVVVYVTLK